MKKCLSFIVVLAMTAWICSYSINEVNLTALQDESTGLETEISDVEAQYTEEDINENQISDLFDEPEVVNRYDVSNQINGYYNANGFNADYRWRCNKDFIDLEGADKITVFSDKNGYISYYDQEKNYMQNAVFSNSDFDFETFDVPQGAEYITASMVAATAEYFTLALGEIGAAYDSNNEIDYGSEDIAYSEGNLTATKEELLADIYVVDKTTGKGDFTSIQEACDSVPDDSVIFIMPGIYEECVSIIGRTLHLKGVDANSTRIISYDDRRDYPALEMTSGSAENLSFESLRNGKSYPSYATPYGAHFDYNEEANYSLSFTNCKFKSEWNSAVGIGTRMGYNLKFSNCEFISTTAGQGTVFLHPSSNASLAGSASVNFNNCIMSSTGQYAMVVMDIGYKGNYIDLIMRNNSLYSNKYGVTDDTIGTQEPSSIYPCSYGENFKETANIHLNPLSFGNNVDCCNY